MWLKWMVVAGEILPRGEVFLAAASIDHRVYVTTIDRVLVLDAHNWREVRSYRSNEWPMGVAMGVFGGSAMVWSSAAGLQLRDRNHGGLICTISFFLDGGWAVTTTDGRYDAPDPGHIPGLLWRKRVDADVPFRMTRVEAFLGEYYTPSLLWHVLADRSLPSLRSWAEVDTNVPTLEVSGFRMSDGDLDVWILLSNMDAINCAPPRVKLFRDGQLVGDSNRGDGYDVLCERQALVFRGVKLPSGRAKLVFSAYAFNSSGVKGRTSIRIFDVPPGLDRRRPTAFVTSVGVTYGGRETAYSGESGGLGLRLSFAEENARQLSDRLSDGLREAGFSEVRAFVFADGDAPGQLPTKPVLSKHLKWLADEAGPEDVVFLYLLSHGIAPKGKFHAILRDAGSGLPDGPDGFLLAAGELASLISPIDAGTVAVVVEACKSGSAVDERQMFAPGVEQTFAQLAYDRRMSVLTASRPGELAGADRSAGGYLAEALVDALERWGGTNMQSVVDIASWLSAAAETVTSRTAHRQQPMFFDFSHSRALLERGLSEDRRDMTRRSR